MKGPGLLSRLPGPRAVSADGLRDVNCGHSSVRSVPSSRLPCVHFLLLASVPTAVTPRRGLEAVFSSHVACLQRPIESPRRGASRGYGWRCLSRRLPLASPPQRNAGGRSLASAVRCQCRWGRCSKYLTGVTYNGPFRRRPHGSPERPPPGPSRDRAAPVGTPVLLAEELAGSGVWLFWWPLLSHCWLIRV